MKRNLIITLLILTQITTQAATIKQLLNEQSLAVVEMKSNEKIQVGENFIVSENQNQCLLEVISVDKKMAIVSSKSCSDKSLLKIGKNIEKSLFDTTLIKKDEPLAEPPTAEQNTPTSPVENQIKSINDEANYKSLIISYMLTPKISITGTAYDGANSEAGSFEYNFKNSFKLGYEYSQFSKNTWNHGFLMDYTNLKFDTATIKGSISAPSTISLTGGMTLLTISYSGKYRWEQIYLPVGLALVSSTVDSTGSFTKTMEARILISYGFGIAITEQFNFEITTNAYSVNSSRVTSGTTTIVPNLGFLTHLQVNAKVLFR